MQIHFILIIIKNMIKIKHGILILISYNEETISEGKNKLILNNNIFKHKKRNRENNSFKEN